MMDKIIEKTEKYIRQQCMIEEGDVVIAGVSGGADSVCLLFVLCALRRRIGFDVKVCHVNHGLRGDAADTDEAYVRELCRRFHTECFVFHENVELIARKRKQSLEEAGRVVRREAFDKVCAGAERAKIATAHHRDDNAETILLNISRGTGLRGLCGIWPVRGRWIRPLLWMSRSQIEAFLTEQNIPWRTDATNDEDDYTRNRIRHHIIPALEEQVNRGAVRHLDELSGHARELWEFLAEETEKARIRCTAQRNETTVFIDGAAFSGEHMAVKRALIKRCIADALGSEKNLTAVHVQDTLELLEKQNSRRVDLPDGVSAVKVYGGIEICASGICKNKVCGEETAVQIPGETRIPDFGNKHAAVISCRITDRSDVGQPDQIPQKSYTKLMDYDIIKHGLSVRTRRPGDYLTVDDRGSRQKLKSYFINEKIPKEERDRMRLIADGSEIVWIPGRRMSRAYYVNDRTERILEIRITEEKANVRDN